jgi:hypothetical protein
MKPRIFRDAAHEDAGRLRPRQLTAEAAVVLACSGDGVQATTTPRFRGCKRKEDASAGTVVVGGALNNNGEGTATPRSSGGEEAAPSPIASCHVVRTADDAACPIECPC